MAAKTRPKPLHDLTIALGASVPHFSQQKFRRQTAHIGLMFLRSLKQNHDYALDGSPLLFVHFGVPEAQRELLGPKHYFQAERGGWSSCCVPKFDYQTFNGLSEPEQDEQTTALLEKALLNVAKQVGADPKPIKEAARMIRDGQYTARFPIPRLTCQSPDGEQTARVFSCVSRGVIRWQIVIEDSAGNTLRSEWVPDSCSRLPDFTEDRLLPRWDKKGYALRDEKGRIRYALSSAEAK